jgi:hypothetical protein
VPLSTQNLSPDITPSAGDTVFTIAPAGRYYISYNVNLDTGVLVGSRLEIGGVDNLASTISETVSTNYSAEVIVTLAANTTVTLELFATAGAVADLQTGAGASLTIMRLDD